MTTHVSDIQNLLADRTLYSEDLAVVAVINSRVVPVTECKVDVMFGQLVLSVDYADNMENNDDDS